MSIWRLADRAERELDRRTLERFLEPGIASAIASMPAVVIESPAPFAVRCDAWLYRAGLLLSEGKP
jgi:hypothetical protein